MTPSAFKLKHKYQEKILIPHEALDPIWAQARMSSVSVSELWHNSPFETTDGVIVSLSFVFTTTIEDCHLDSYSKDLYSMSFDKYKHIWVNCYGRLSGVWSVVKMVEVKKLD